MAQGADQHDRLTRIEEGLGFCERTSEQLGEEIRALGKRVAEVARRVEAMERRLAGAIPPEPQQATDEEPPPAPPF